LTKYACTIDANGITALSYAEILAGLQDDFRTIYGDDVYIETDSQDGQLLAVFAKAIDDGNQATIDAFNSFSPSKAQGAGLSSNVKLNGISRNVSSNSTVVVTLVGVVGTPINNGIVADALTGTNWALPTLVTIPSSGQIDVTATAVDLGAIRAEPGAITKIVTSVPNWQTVTNAGPAVPGAPVEIDAQLRRRQSKSTATPAQTVREAIYGGVANVPGVIRAQVYDNDKNTATIDGIPAHNIAVVVEGGDTTAVATQIAFRKPPGTPTYGNISIDVVDTHGVPNSINFFALIDVVVKPLLFISAQTGYVSSTADVIKQAVAYLLANQDIGVDSLIEDEIAPTARLKGTPAVEGTGLPQDQLDILSKTYKLTQAAQARSDMLVTGGPFAAGATAINVAHVTDIIAGKTCFLTLDNGSYWQVLISSVVGNTINFLGYAIPGGRSVNTGSLVYVVGDLIIAFKEATTALVTDVTVANV
jgi:uncharacterized phage protein gp47/JayE